jgi:peroxiredoxin
MKTPILTAGIATLLALAGCITANQNVGEAAPAFTLKDSNGQIVTLDSFAGKPVVILFGSLKGCETCAAESKNVLKPLHDELGDEAGFLTVSILPQIESDQDLNQFKQDYGLSWSHARDTNGMTRQYQITQLSTVVVLDSRHNIVLQSVEPGTSKIREALEL